MELPMTAQIYKQVNLILFALCVFLSDHNNRDGAVPGPVHVQRIWQVREDSRHGGLLLPQPTGAQDLPFPR